MDVEEVKEGHKRNKEKARAKEKKNKGSGYNVKAEKAQASGLMVEQHHSEHVEGELSKCGMEIDKSITEEEEEGGGGGGGGEGGGGEIKAEMAGNEQLPVASTDENAGLGHAEMDKGEKEQGTKFKKSKRKHVDGEPAAGGSASDEIMTNRDKKKRRKEHSVELKEDDQVNISKMAVNIKGNKKRINERDKFNPDLSNNTSTGGDEMKQLGENRLEMIRASSKHPELKGFWSEIGH